MNRYGEVMQDATKDDRKRILKEFSEMLDRQVCFNAIFEFFPRV